MNENRVLSEEPVKKDSIREWSPIRCIISPIILVSKNPIGNFINFIRKSDIREMLILALMCNKIQLRIKPTDIWLKNNINWAINTNVIKLKLFVPIPTSTTACVKNGNIN